MELSDRSDDRPLSMRGRPVSSLKSELGARVAGTDPAQSSCVDRVAITAGNLRDSRISGDFQTVMREPLTGRLGRCSPSRSGVPDTFPLVALACFLIKCKVNLS